MEAHLGFGFGIRGNYLGPPLRIPRVIANEINQRKAAIKHTQNKGGLGVARKSSQHFQSPHEGQKKRKSGSKMS